MKRTTVQTLVTLLILFVVLAGAAFAAQRVVRFLRPVPPPPVTKYVYRDRPPPAPDTVRVPVPYKVEVYRRGEVRVDTVYVPAPWGRVGVIPLAQNQPAIRITSRRIEVPVAVDGQVQVYTYAVPRPGRYRIAVGAFYAGERIEPGARFSVRLGPLEGALEGTPSSARVGITVGRAFR